MSSLAVSSTEEPQTQSTSIMGGASPSPSSISAIDTTTTPQQVSSVPVSVRDDIVAVLQSKCERLRAALTLSVDSQKAMVARHAQELAALRENQQQLKVAREVDQTVAEGGGTNRTQSLHMNEVALKLHSLESKVVTFVSLCRDQEPDVYQIAHEFLVKRGKDPDHHKTKRELFEELRAVKQTRRLQAGLGSGGTQSASDFSTSGSVGSPLVTGRPSTRGTGASSRSTALAVRGAMRLSSSLNGPSSSRGQQSSSGKKLLPASPFTTANADDSGRQRGGAELSEDTDALLLSHPSKLLAALGTKTSTADSPSSTRREEDKSEQPQGEKEEEEEDESTDLGVAKTPASPSQVAGVSLSLLHAALGTSDSNTRKDDRNALSSGSKQASPPSRRSADPTDRENLRFRSKADLIELVSQSTMAIQMLQSRLSSVNAELSDAQQDLDALKKSASSSKSRETKLEQELHRAVVTALKRESGGGGGSEGRTGSSLRSNIVGGVATVFMTEPPTNQLMKFHHDGDEEARSMMEGDASFNTPLPPTSSPSTARPSSRGISLGGFALQSVNSSSQLMSSTSNPQLLLSPTESRGAQQKSKGGSFISSGNGHVTAPQLPAIPGSGSIILSARSRSSRKMTNSRHRGGTSGGGKEDNPQFSPDETSSALFRRILTAFCADVGSLLTCAQLDTTKSFRRLLTVTGAVCNAVTSMERKGGVNELSCSATTRSTAHPTTLTSWLLIQAAGWGEEELQSQQVPLLSKFSVPGATLAHGGAGKATATTTGEEGTNPIPTTTSSDNFFASTPLVELLSKKPEFQKLAEEKKNQFLQCPSEWNHDIEMLTLMWSSLMDFFRQSVRQIQSQLSQLFSSTLKHIENGGGGVGPGVPSTTLTPAAQS